MTTQYVLEPPGTPSVAVAGETARFAVRRIFCVGRNYAAHAREMGSDPEREPPFFFSKPADAVIDAGLAEDAHLPYPPGTRDLHHEVELVVAIRQGGVDIAPEAALDHVFGYATGLDLTRRDLQAAAKAKGRPWDLAKGFDRSAPIAPLQRVADVGHPNAGRIWLDVDEARRQDADIGDLIWPVPDVLSILSGSIALRPGDLVFTGTPAGVGPIGPGQRVRAGIEGLGELGLTVAR